MDEENTGVNESTAAEQTTATETPAESSENVETSAEVKPETAEQATQTSDDNAKYAAARRQAEAEIAKRDAEIARRFQGVTNPITGQPIRSERDYFDALDAQEELERNQKLKDAGVDPDLIDRAVNNSPVIKQAQEIIEENRREALDRDIADQVAEISKLDPNIKSYEDLELSPSKADMLNYVKRGYSLVDAYKLANFNSLVGNKAQAAQQAAINQIKGKSHLTPTDAAHEQAGEMEIPEAELPNWKEFYPDLSMKDLRAKYNRVHNRR